MRVPGSIIRLVPLFSFLLVFIVLLSARPSVAQEQFQVLANLPLEGMKVNHMFVQQVGNKTFLYLHRPRKDVFALVDVSDPRKPALVSRDALQGTTSGPTGSAFAVTITPTQMDPDAKLPTDRVKFVDLSDPKKIKTLKTFEGVTAVLNDDSHKLVYMVNGEGLWIVSHHMRRIHSEADYPELAGP